MPSQYYTLISSLPHLEYFERAERLSINRARLDGRLSLLDEEDKRQLVIAQQLLEWRYQPLKRTAFEVAAQYRRHLPELSNAELCEFVQLRFAQRTALAALRRRHAGLGPGGAGEVWGVTPQVRMIERHYNEPDFGLAGRHLWLAETEEMLKHGDALGIERAQMALIWRYLSQVADRFPFGFEAVFAYVFKWDITHRWLGRNAEGAAQRFDKMLEEGLRDVSPIFA